MAGTWKYLGEKVGIPFGVWFITSGILQIFNKYGDMSMIKSLFYNFVVELWPGWVGIAAVLIYWFISFSVKVFRTYTPDKIKKIEDQITAIKLSIPLLDMLRIEVMALKEEPANRIESYNRLVGIINKLEINVNNLNTEIGLDDPLSTDPNRSRRLNPKIREKL